MTSVIVAPCSDLGGSHAWEMIHATPQRRSSPFQAETWWVGRGQRAPSRAGPTTAGRRSDSDHEPAERRREPFEVTNPQRLSDPQIQHILWALHGELAGGCPAGRLYGESLATALAVHLLRQYSAFPVKFARRSGRLASGPLQRVVEFMHANL